jgi:PEGA domain
MAGNRKSHKKVSNYARFVWVILGARRIFVQRKWKMKTTLNLGTIAGLFLCVLVLTLSVCFAGELIEPSRTLQEAGKTWGGLTIFSEPPQLDVYLDGEKVGQTPLWLRKVETGLHRIKIGPAETSVRIEKDKKIKLGLLKGSFVISSEPAKETPKVSQPSEQQAVAPPQAQAGEDERTEDLTLWEKFVNGSLKHF